MIRKFIRRWLNSAQAKAQPCAISTERNPGNIINDSITNGGMTIHMKPVNGGTIVMFQNYNKKQDRYDYNTYIITDEQDFVPTLSKIIVVEKIKL